MVEMFCLWFVAAWFRHPVYTVWLFDWGILFVLCGCMVEVSCLYSVAVWLSYPVCVCCVAIWLRYPFYIVWLYGWGVLFVSCCFMVEEPFLYCVALWLRYPFYCMAVWLRYPFLYCVAVWLMYHFSYCVALCLRCVVCIVWLYAWGTLFILCGSVDEVCCLYCVAVWLKYPDCIVWLYVLRYLDFRAQTMYCNRGGIPSVCWDCSVQWALPLSPCLPTFQSLFFVMFLIWYAKLPPLVPCQSGS
jgi:hypothetical protein